MEQNGPGVERMQELLAVARGERPADLVIRGGRVADVFSGTWERMDVAVHGGWIVGLGEYRGRREIDASGRVVAPGFIEGHIHLESTLLCPSEFACLVVPHGTTTVVADPHEIANVLGVEGVEYMLDATRDLPLHCCFLLPSCVPATHMETAGARFGLEEMLRFKHRPRILGLAEMMNFPGAVHGDREVLEKLSAFAGSVRDGHAPLLSGKELNAYLLAGPRSDHECTRLEEAQEKLSRGMRVMIREGTSARDLDALLPLVSPLNARRFLLVTDDRHPHELLERGHVDYLVRRAVEGGLDPIQAIRMVTLNAAEYFGFPDRGALAPGYRADVLVLEDLESVSVDTVIRNGAVVCSGGRLCCDLPPGRLGNAGDTVRLGAVSPDSFRIPASGTTARVMEVLPGRILTGCSTERVRVVGGEVRADPERDVLKLAVVERHHRSGRIGLGLVRGFGLRRGALASSVAHDSHNIVVVGVEEAAMVRAVREIERLGGGLAAVGEDRVAAALPLPVAGLMSLEPADAVVRRKERLGKAARELGCPLPDPFMALSFLALPVIPELKLTDHGLVDVGQFRIVSLFE